MNIAKVSINNIRHKPLSALLSILLLSFGVGIILLLMATSKKLEDQFTKNIAGIDMVVGAKGSPLQLILSSVYQVDAPTGNISLNEFEKLAKNPMVSGAIPLAYGDNYKGYRIIGTSLDYPKHYQAELQSGVWWNEVNEVVIGSMVADNTGLKIGSEFSSSHGLTESVESHDHVHNIVVGIMNKTNTVADKLILTSPNSVWAAHHDSGPEKEITAGLITFRSPMAMMTLPRMINEKTQMQAALPAIEVNRLFSLMGTGVKTLKALGILIISLSVISIFISMFQSLKERKVELALMRSMGASRTQLLGMVILEGLFISFAGYLAGLLFGKISLIMMSKMAQDSYQYAFDINIIGTDELIILPIVLSLGLLAAILPAIQAYRISISKVLANA